MLTPGEFVINASSAQSNMGLLHAINSGSLRGYNAGGVVRRFQEGGEAKEDKKGSFSMPSNETLENMLLDWDMEGRMSIPFMSLSGGLKLTQKTISDMVSIRMTVFG